MIRRNAAGLCLAGVLSLAATLAFAQETPPAAPEPTPAPAVDRDAGLSLWEDIHAVFSHPRCANCHVEDDFPRWSGDHYGEKRVHGMNVQRGADGFGNVAMRCATCHGAENADIPHGPPGAESWHLAPVEMVWWRRSSAEICAQIKDPLRNGGRDLAEIARHVRDDPLVRWGWEPGPGREPAPGSPEETYDKLIAWAETGAPCPVE